jgi:bifunctional UDP-N-acetylglucosamine pyrophosphorylase/glucosamine-1-phosphate N-acetyltransferase
MNPEVSVIVLAAGLGTRMRSEKAKVLHEAGGDTLLNHIIRAACAVAAPENITVVVGHQAETVRKSVTLRGVSFALQAEQKGTGHAVLCARDSIADRSGMLLVLNGDGPLLKGETLRSLIEAQAGSRNAATIVTTIVEDPTGYGRIVRGSNGDVAGIVEHKAANPEELGIREINPGLYCFEAPLFWDLISELQPNPAANEYYVTDMVHILRAHGHSVGALLVRDETELLGINTRLELATADQILRRRKAEELMLSGVTIENPASVAIDFPVQAGSDTIIEAHVQLRGRTRIGRNCRIGTGSVLKDCEVGDDVLVLPYVVAESSRISNFASVGPFSRLRMNAEAGEGTHIGNFVELKNTRLGRGSKASHLAYLGDSEVAGGVNIGAGTITCNYDGVQKHRTIIDESVFVGSNSTLVAPVKIGRGAYIGAGSVITKEVEADALALGRAYQVDKPGWAKRRRESKRNS